MKKKIKFPEKGMDKTDLIQMLKDKKGADAKWKEGKTFSYVYFAGDEILSLVQEAYQLYFSENALNPTAFKSLREMEVAVIEMVSDLFHGDEKVTGSMTSGGTESILMAVKTAREWARKKHPEILNPEIVLSATAHPAFHKACYYFNIKPIVIPVEQDFRVSPIAMEKAITANTILMVASAPAYPQGVIDPIEMIGQIALKKNILFHVDACVGGFMLPFLQQLNYPIPNFDFSVPGVTSISADIHKYGYAAKGASVIMYKNAELRKAQFYVYTPWSGGIYASPTMTGTRPGGAIAAAWSAFQFIGKSGYQAKAKIAMDTTIKIKEGIQTIPELKILASPDMTIMAVASDVLDIYEVGDEMGLLGWMIDRQQLPPSLHLTITPAHEHLVEIFLKDLNEAVAKTKKMSLHSLEKKVQLNAVKGLKKVLPSKMLGKFQNLAAKHSKIDGNRSAAMYGMMGELQGGEGMEDMIKEFLDQLMR